MDPLALKETAAPNLLFKAFPLIVPPNLLHTLFKYL